MFLFFSVEVWADLVIALSYFSISFQLIYFYTELDVTIKNTKYYTLTGLFASFILLCGTTHFIRAIIPEFNYILVIAKVLTAIASLITTITLSKFIPKLILFYKDSVNKDKFIQRQIIELNQARLNAESANAAKNEFINILCHEIRNPLFVVLSSAELLLASPDINEIKQFGQSILDAAMMMKDIATDVLDVSKIQAGKMQYKNETVDLQSFCTKIINNMKSYAIFSNTKLCLQYNFKEKLFILADQTKLSQILINLLSNAIKFTENGKVTLKIQHFNYPIFAENFITNYDSPNTFTRKLIKPEEWVSVPILSNHNRKLTAESKVWVIFEVIDTGVGLTRQSLDKLFKPFSQTAITHQKNPGSGLGLFLIYKLVESWGGEIIVQSKIGVGTHFIIVLNFQKSTANIQRINEKIDLKFINILIVDDEVVNRKLLRRILEKANANVFECENGLKAVNFIKNSSTTVIHCILMDIVMAGMDGFEATERIKNIKQIPVIGLTGNADEFNTQKGKLDYFLTKPIISYELFRTIKKVLNVTEIVNESTPLISLL